MTKKMRPRGWKNIRHRTFIFVRPRCEFALGEKTARLFRQKKKKLFSGRHRILQKYEKYDNHVALEYK